MKKYIFIALFVLSNTFVLSAQDNAWFKIKDLDAAYIVEFPSEPIKGGDDVSTEQGTVKMDTYTLQPEEDNNLIYMTSFTKYPDYFFKDGLDTAEAQNTVLDNSIEGAVINTKGTLLADEKITLNGYRGRNAKIKIDGGYIINIKIVLVNYSLYLAQVIYIESNDDNISTKRFFESLELINVNK